MKCIFSDSREELRKMLEDFGHRHPSQAPTVQEMLRRISERHDCFSRSELDGHFTGSAWLVNPANNRVLLTLHRNLKRWMQTGGHADGDSCLLRVALREAEEESGISGIVPLSAGVFDVDIHAIPNRPDRHEPAHLHYDVRFLLQAPHEEFSISDESDDLKWWSAEEILQQADSMDESVQRMAKRWMENAC
ncbi:MAG: NUDIX hydrolase [Akkermansia sp.]|nr:NUDIX hydrolase [Akkermansia sp.]